MEGPLLSHSDPIASSFFQFLCRELANEAVVDFLKQAVARMHNAVIRNSRVRLEYRLIKSQRL